VYEFPDIVIANVVGPNVDESQPATFAWFKTAAISMGVVAVFTILLVYTSVAASLRPPRMALAVESDASALMSTYLGMATAARMPRMIMIMISSTRVNPFFCFNTFVFIVPIKYKKVI